MECRDTCRAISRFLAGDYPIEEQEELVWHIRSCPSCKEELRINLTLQMALDALDDNTDFIYMDSEEGMQKLLAEADQKVHLYNQYLRIRYSLNTVAGWAVFLVLILQILYWMHM